MIGLGIDKNLDLRSLQYIQQVLWHEQIDNCRFPADVCTRCIQRNYWRLDMKLTYVHHTEPEYFYMIVEQHIVKDNFSFFQEV